MPRHHLSVAILCLIIMLTINLFIYGHYALSLSKRQRSSKTIVYSGITINSFNPPLLNILLNFNITPSNTISIIDNNAFLLHSLKPSQTSIITMILSDGFHHLDILMIDQIQNIEFYQQIDISTGTQSLLLTVLDQQYKTVENISVHLELVDYSHISLDYYTNDVGEVIFNYLPRHSQVYIEAICMKTKRYGFIEIDTLDYRTVTVILKDMNTVHHDEYDRLDQGYYSV